jgi:hypothetical protein
MNMNELEIFYLTVGIVVALSLNDELENGFLFITCVITWPIVIIAGLIRFLWKKMI